jgi:hypothetical protein
VLEGKVIGRCVSRHRHQEFIRFIAIVERFVPAGKVTGHDGPSSGQHHRCVTAEQKRISPRRPLEVGHDEALRSRVSIRRYSIVRACLATIICAWIP